MTVHRAVACRLRRRPASIVLPLFIMGAVIAGASGCYATRQSSDGVSAESDSTASNGATSAGTTKGVPIAVANDAVPDDSAAVLLRELERHLRAPGAAVIRRRLFEWMMVSRTLGAVELDERPIADLETSATPLADDLRFQYSAAVAVWCAARPAAERVGVEPALAGFRSMIAAYRNVSQSDTTLRDPLLERWDGMRRRDELRGYIERTLRSR